MSVLGADDIALIKKVTQFAETVERAARDGEPHRITTYLEELARMSHGWYHTSRVLGEAPAVEQSRLLLARGVRQVFGNALALLGISAPDRM